MHHASLRLTTGMDRAGPQSRHLQVAIEHKKLQLTSRHDDQENTSPRGAEVDASGLLEVSCFNSHSRWSSGRGCEHANGSQGSAWLLL